MRKLTYLLPAILISGCSLLDTNSGYRSNVGCEPQPQHCAPGQSYAVASEHHNVYDSHQYQYSEQHSPSHETYAQYPQQVYSQGGAIQNDYAHTVQKQQHYAPTDYAHSGPGHSVPSEYTYGQQQGQYGAPVLRDVSGPGYPTGLRGRKNPAYLYGTLGGVLYDTDAESYGLEGRLGYHSGRILGAELEGSLGVIEDEENIAGVSVESKFDYNIAAFALARLPLSERFSVHARGGYDVRRFSVTGTDAAGQGSEGDLDLDGFAYGIGAEYGLSPRNGLRVDYTRYDNDIGAIDSVSASFVRKF